MTAKIFTTDMLRTKMVALGQWLDFNCESPEEAYALLLVLTLIYKEQLAGTGLVQEHIVDLGGMKN